VDITVVGIFDSVKLAEEARRVLLAVGVPEARIVLNEDQDGLCSVGVHAQSSFERQRVRELLQRNGASRTEQRPG